VRNKIKRIGIAAAAATAIGAGVLGMAPAASAQAPNPCPATDPYQFFSGNQWGAGWGEDGVLQSWDVAGTSPVIISCKYYGESWVFVPQQGNHQVGYTTWTVYIPLA
jgi:hypothetical protein